MFHSKECINNVRVKMLNFLYANDKKESRTHCVFLLIAMMRPQNAIAFNVRHVTFKSYVIAYQPGTLGRDGPKNAIIAQRLSRK